MNHEPYEEWLLSGEELTADQQQSLDEHLANCPECVTISTAWEGVHQAMRFAPEVEPEPGFTTRWQTNLAKRRAAAARRSTWIALLVCVGGLLLTLIGLAMPEIQGIPSPIQLLSGTIFSLAEILVTVQDMGAWVLSFLRGVPIYVSLLLWIAISTALLLWSLVWMIGIWRLPHLQRSQNEIHH
ncbi:MAG TPA: zf-HC2 domain-containing protein [Anaerolineaceae bacterium]|jgi:anti-sigma factor RsiW